MNTIENLRSSLRTLVSEQRSGIIALCGDAAIPAAGESFFENHEALVYIHSLDTMYAITFWGGAYENTSVAMTDDSLFECFADRDDNLRPECLGLTEQSYLNLCTDCLLCDMEHDDGECPELDCEDFNERYIYPMDTESPDAKFRLTGASDIHSDIEKIHSLAESDGTFSVDMPGGNTLSFCVSRSDEVYSLYLLADEPFNDGNECITVQRYHRLLRTLDWRTLYAKGRAFVYNNFVNA